jgi:hypothetical protein
MGEQFKRCVIYVDYEDLLSGLSRFQYLDIDNLLAHLLAKARQRFAVQQAIVLGDWMFHPNHSQLEELGFVCYSNPNAEATLQQALQSIMSEHLAANQGTEAYILVGGQSSYNAILRTCLRANKNCLLWTLMPPSPSDQELCTEWEVITLPYTDKSSLWPRQVMLQAIALAADHLYTNTEAPFSLSQLHDQLAILTPFQGRADTWLDIAIREQILLPQLSAGKVDQFYASVNRQHVLVQKAFITRERILLTLSALQANRDWVAFSALEKALRSAIVLAEQQSLRHAWLELLIAEHMLVAGKFPQPGGSFQVTTLRLNPIHSAVAALPQLQERNLRRLIVIMRHFMERKRSTWMAVSRLLKSLTAITTRVEARAAISMAEQGGIIHIDSLSATHNATFSVTIAKLEHYHLLVQGTFARLDQLIQLINEIQDKRGSGVSETILVDRCCTAMDMQEDEAFFWLRLLLSEGMLYTKPISLGVQEAMPILYLNQQDPTVDQLLDETVKSIYEVQK